MEKGTRSGLPLWAICFLLLVLAGGCQSVITLKMPDQFADKKMKEDPPPDYNADNNDLGLGVTGTAGAK